MYKRLSHFMTLLIAGLDVCILNISFLLVQLFFKDRIPQGFQSSYFQFWVVINISWALTVSLGGIYLEKNILSFESLCRQTLRVYMLWVMSIVIYYFLSKEIELSRSLIIVIIITFGAGLLINRFFYLCIQTYFKGSGQLTKRILILGYNNIAKKLALNLEEEGINTHIIGFAEDFKNITELSHYPIVSQIDNAVEMSKQLDVHEIFSTITPQQNFGIYDLMKKAETECIRFKIVPDLTSFTQKPVFVNYLGDMPILSFKKEPLEDFGNSFRKRAFDFVISLFVVVFILSWLIPLLGILIFLESPGAIFFKQARTGRNNKNFNCLKFRSMKKNKSSDIHQATRNDKRITFIGKIIRRTSLDEFPQFINVLMGDMSIVGPRPHMVKHTSDYSKIVNEYMTRHLLKPGITGWAQIQGYRGEIVEDEQIIRRVEADLWYSENWSFWLDVKIVFLTVLHLITSNKNVY